LLATIFSLFLAPRLTFLLLPSVVPSARNPPIFPPPFPDISVFRKSPFSLPQSRLLTETVTMVVHRPVAPQSLPERVLRVRSQLFRLRHPPSPFFPGPNFSLTFIQMMAVIFFFKWSDSRSSFFLNFPPSPLFGVVFPALVLRNYSTFSPDPPLTFQVFVFLMTTKYFLPPRITLIPPCFTPCFPPPLIGFSSFFLNGKEHMLPPSPPPPCPVSHKFSMPPLYFSRRSSIRIVRTFPTRHYGFRPFRRSQSK